MCISIAPSAEVGRGVKAKVNCLTVGFDEPQADTGTDVLCWLLARSCYRTLLGKVRNIRVPCSEVIPNISELPPQEVSHYMPANQNSA